MGLSADDSAILVVDVQNDYCHPQGALGSVGRVSAEVDRVVNCIEELLQAARRTAVPVIFLRMASGAWFTDHAWARRGVGGAEAAEAPPIAEWGSWGAELYRLQPQSGDLVLDKYRHSGFPYTPLPLVLRALRRNTLIIVGVSTDVCVEATARDAVTHGYEVVVVPECVAGTSAAQSDASLQTVAGYIGRTAPLADVLGELSSTSSA